MFLNKISATEMLDIPVILYIEEDLRQFVETSTPSTLHGMNRSYEFSMGEGITPLIEASMRNIFRDIEISRSEPTAESLRASGRAGVLRIGLNGTVIDLQFEPQFVGANARTNYMIDLGVEFSDTEGNTIFKNKSRGSGFSTVQTSDAEGASFVEGIDFAIQEAVDRLSEIVLRAGALRDYSPAPPAIAEAAPQPPALPATPLPSTSMKVPSSAEPLERDLEECPANDPESARSRVRTATKLLHAGKPKVARRELILALCQEPNHSTAKDLLRQTDAPIEELEGLKTIEYTVQSGDSLSRIAEKFMNDSLQFYVLARINGITEPGMLTAGRTIKIPVNKDAAIKLENSDITPPAISSEPAGGKYKAPLEVALSAKDNRDKAPAIYFTTDGTAPTDASQRYTEPIELASSATVRFMAIDAAGNVSRIRSDSYSLDPIESEAEKFFNKGLRHAENDKKEDAYEAFAKALKLDPSHAGAKRETAKIKPALAEQYRRIAKNALRTQDLNKTIEYWGKVLELYPSDELAKIERTRAMELKNRLEKIGGDQPN